jgi:hypothetical protein
MDGDTGHGGIMAVRRMAQPGNAEGSAGTAQDIEAARCAVLLKSERNNEEGLSDDRYACFLDLDTWRD